MRDPYNGKMLSEEELGGVCVVLVRARNPANIGAVARAMHDFGFGRLRMVNEFAVPFEAARSAVDASVVMENAVLYASVADAVADCTLVVGTTAVGERDLQHPLLTLARAVPRMRSELRRKPLRGDEAPTDSSPARPKVAILFGSEKTGLSNEELSHCNWLLTIPMHHHAELRHPSMNLGQAVAVCLYELVREPMDHEHAITTEPLRDPSATADAATLERVTGLLTAVLEKTEYTRRHAANSSAENVRRLVRRMHMSPAEAPVWMGILRQMLWKLGEPES
ncbi:MAG TPA: TrmH family RNA methyltransferase [Acidobacteriaceae bacterium]|nr:TrmH family RNA methyltransferase [Acidobacteriaceae bacterium]